MIVTCECENCLLKELCINRNQRLKSIEGHDWFYVNLICKHKYPDKVIDKFDCDKCINKPICRVHHEALIRSDIILATCRNDIKKALYKLPDQDAFEAVLCCKGYMTK